MRTIIKKDYEALSRKAALIIKQRILEKPNLILGLATGSTPLGTYQELTRMHRKEGLDFSQVSTFNLDEYISLPPSHSQSYHYYMEENFLKHINIKRENVFIPQGKAENIEEHCRWYENQIKKRGGIDLQILGIGKDGHIGFNEPGSSLTSRTRKVDLDEITIKDNSRFFQNISEVPRQAITMGMGTILEAKEIILLASGTNKAEIIYRAFAGPISLEVPASALQRHREVTVILDQEATTPHLSTFWEGQTKVC